MRKFYARLFRRSGWNFLRVLRTKRLWFSDRGIARDAELFGHLLFGHVMDEGVLLG